jgi:hypothetical protein
MSAVTRQTPAGAGRGSSEIDGEDDQGKRTSKVDFVGKFRVKYKVAGAVYRDVMRRANSSSPPLGARERAVLAAVLDRTTSYSKLVDTTSARQLAAIAYGFDDPDDVHGHQRKRTRELLDGLAKRGLCEITPCGRGRSARLIVSVSAETHPTRGVIDFEDEERMTPASARNDPYGSHGMTPASAAHLEDLDVLGDERELVDAIPAIRALSEKLSLQRMGA